jgi:hypothetical protein
MDSSVAVSDSNRCLLAARSIFSGPARLLSHTVLLKPDHKCPSTSNIYAEPDLMSLDPLLKPDCIVSLDF